MEGEAIKYFINVRVHTRGCNLKCDYCYLPQFNHKNDGEANTLRYPLQNVLQAFSKERLGGKCHIQIIGDGETLLPLDIEDIIQGLIREGHRVSVTTNGTITQKIKRIVEWSIEESKQSDISFVLSLHYLELQRLGFLDAFADTVEFLREKGIGFHVNLTMGGSYVPVIDDIMEYCESKLRVKPDENLFVDVARNEGKDGEIEVITGRYSKEEYYNAVKRFNSQGFEREWREFGQRINGFCYAGSWAFMLDLTTGLCTQCLGKNDINKFNFFESIDKKLALEPVGYRCKEPFCKCGMINNMNVMPEEYESKNAYCDLYLGNRLFSEEEKARSNRRSIELEQLKKSSIYIAACFRDKQYKEGFELAEKILAEDVDPNNYYVVQLVLSYGYALLEVGEIQKALDLECCYNDLNYLADYCLMMGVIYLRNEMVEDAIRLFEDATRCYAVYEKGTNTWLPYYNLGVIYECLGNVELAIQYYQKCENYEKAMERIKELE